MIIFKNLLRFSLMWDIIRWSYDAIRRHTTSCDVEAHRTIFVQWSCDDIVRLQLLSHDIVRLHLGSYNIARPSYDRRTTSLRSHDHRATLMYKSMLASHHAIIVKSYIIVRLSFDWRTIYLRFHRHYRCVANPSLTVTTKLRLQYRSRVGKIL